jgi:hypothetical protein
MNARLMTLLASAKKALGGLLGGATGVGVAGLLALFGVHLDPAVTAALATVLASAGVYIAPPNAQVASAQKTSPADSPQ